LEKRSFLSSSRRLPDGALLVTKRRARTSCGEAKLVSRQAKLLMKPKILLTSLSEAPFLSFFSFGGMAERPKALVC